MRAEAAATEVATVTDWGSSTGAGSPIDQGVDGTFRLFATVSSTYRRRGITGLSATGSSLRFAVSCHVPALVGHSRVRLARRSRANDVGVGRAVGVATG